MTPPTVQHPHRDLYQEITSHTHCCPYHPCQCQHIKIEEKANNVLVLL